MAEALDEIEDAQDLGAVADHLTVAGLSPAQHTVAVRRPNVERQATFAVGVEHAVRVDDPAMEGRSAAGTGTSVPVAKGRVTGGGCHR